MARPLTWRSAIIKTGAGPTQPDWSFSYPSVALPNGHTIIRIVCWGQVALKGTANSGAVADLVPPTMWNTWLQMGTHGLHYWGVSSRVAIAEMYDNSLIGGTGRVPYWWVQSDAWDINITPNYKIPASGTNTIVWNASAFGPNTFVNGTYNMNLNMRVLTMAP